MLVDMPRALLVSTEGPKGSEVVGTDDKPTNACRDWFGICLVDITATGVAAFAKFCIDILVTQPEVEPCHKGGHDL